MKIDYSQLQCFINCPRKYYYKYVEKLKKVSYDERELDKDFGKCIHKALEILYKTGSLIQAKEVFRGEYIGLESEKAKTPANGERLIEAYWKYWQTPTSALSDKNLETVGVELTDSFKLTEDIEYIVKIDLIVKNNAGYWCVDHKTSRSIAYNYFWQFDPNMQMSGYCKYVLEKYGQCSGAIINVMCVGFRQRAYKGQPAGFHCEFARDIINRNSAQLSDFTTNAERWATTLRFALDTGFSAFRRNEGACHQFKGCSYRELCNSCNDSEIKATLYEEHNPLAYLEEK